MHPALSNKNKQKKKGQMVKPCDMIGYRCCETNDSQFYLVFILYVLVLPLLFFLYKLL